MTECENLHGNETMLLHGKNKQYRKETNDILDRIAQNNKEIKSNLELSSRIVTKKIRTFKKVKESLARFDVMVHDLERFLMTETNHLCATRQYLSCITQGFLSSRCK